MPIIFSTQASHEFPLHLKVADVVFMAGDPASENTPHFEHVALVYEARSVSRPEDLKQVKVMGLPESTSPAPALLPTTFAGYWEKKRQDFLNKMASAHPSLQSEAKAAYPGASGSGWNLILQAEGMQNLDRFSFSLTGEMAFNLHSCRYGKSYERTPENRLNCLGFVHEALCQERSFAGTTKPAFLPQKLLGSPFPEYEIPGNSPFRDTERRIHPAVGHLACALELSPDKRPYCPEKPERAAQTALAQAFLRGLQHRN